MHRNHLAPYLVFLVLGVALLLAAGVRGAAVGTVVLVLLCPLLMVGMMWGMAGHGHGSRDQS